MKNTKKNFFFLFLLFGFMNAKAQAWLPIGEEIATLSSKTEVYGQGCKIYKPASYSDFKLYMTPVFVFESEHVNHNMIKVDIIEPIKAGGKWKLKISLLSSPTIVKKSLVDIIRAELSQQQELVKFKDIRDENLIPLTVKSISIVQDDDLSEKIFTDFTATDNQSSKFALVAKFDTKDDALRIKTRLQNRTLPIAFKIQYSLNARITNSVSSAQGQIIQLKDIDAVKKLVGNAHNPNMDPSLAQDKYVSRDQKEKFTGELSRQIQSKLTIGNEADLDFLKDQIKKFLDFSVFTQTTIEDNFGKELQRQSDYGFDPKDIKPDEINTLIDDVKRFLQTESQTKLDTKVSAEVGIKFLSTKIDYNMNKEDLAKLLQDNGWKIEQHGTIYNVKGLDIFVTNTQRLLTSTTSEFDIIRTSQSDISLSSNVSTENTIYPSSELSEGINNILPIGIILAFAGDTSKIPDGWLLCGGKTLSTDKYSGLFGIVRNNWGGDGVDSFKLPDLRAQFLRGADLGSTLDQDANNRTTSPGGGSVKMGVGSYENDATKRPNSDFVTGYESNDHTHQYRDSYYSEVNGNGDHTGLTGNNYPRTDTDNTNYFFEYTTGPENQKHTHTVTSGGDKETRPTNAAVNYIIKWK